MKKSALMEELLDPNAYGHAVSRVEFLQTHISLLFFAGERVYKIKKPVDMGFLDFTTLERRKHFCEEEVRLNRRLAPDVYLGTVPIVRSRDGALRVASERAPEPGEETVEWAVEMVRLPAAGMLEKLLDEGEIDNERMNAVASLLAGFHAAAPTGAGVDEYGAPATVAANVEENFEQLAPFVDGAGGDLAVLSPTRWSFLAERQRGALATQHELLERRVREGRTRDGHGDLHAGNICFPGAGVVAYDCIEFNERFRAGDVAADLAFLTMDLDHRGYPGFAGYLERRYAEVAKDPGLRVISPFYKTYRAVVRGKVAALTAAGTNAGDVARGERRREAMRYLHLAVSYELPPGLVLMCGLPASGKSWFARQLARPLRAPVLRSDVRRKLAAGIAPTTHVQEEYGAGMYSPEKKRATYRSLLEGVTDILRAGRSVIVDATFSTRESRAPFRDAAGRLDVGCTLVHVEASEATTRERLERRRTSDPEASDADLEVYLAARAAFEPPDELPERAVVRLVSDEAPPEERIGAYLDRRIGLFDSPG